MPEQGSTPKELCLEAGATSLPPGPTWGLANRTKPEFQPPLAHPSEPRACDQGTNYTTVNRGLAPEFTFPCKGA